MSDTRNEFGKPQEFGEFGATSDDDVEAHLFERPAGYENAK